MMTIKEHLENFISQPDVDKYVRLYEDILEGNSSEWLEIYYALVREISQDRKLFVTADEQLKEYGGIRDTIEELDNEHDRNLLITALFDALMVEKIKTYSLSYDAPAILSDEIHEEYLREYVYDDEDGEIL